jgi:hypothetical protein
MSDVHISDEDFDKLMRISYFYGFSMEIAKLLEDPIIRKKVLSIMSKYKIDALLAIQVSENPDDQIDTILGDFFRAEAIDHDNEGPIGGAIDHDNEGPIGGAIDPSGAAANVECSIEKFKWLIESEECQKLQPQCLIEPLTEIIGNRAILAQMCEENPERFIDIFDKHFIEKHNTFTLINDPIKSMAMEFVMRKWH